MGMLTTKDGTSIYYKDWGTGQPIVFSHGWPLDADAWDDQMMFLASRGFRCIAHDRRGWGRSTQSWDGNGVDTYADDLAALVTSLHLENVVHVGHSAGAGEIARYCSQHGTRNVSRVVLISTVTPHMIKTSANRPGVHRSSLDQMRARVVEDRPQFFKELAERFFGANLSGWRASDGLREWFASQGMRAGLRAVHEGIKAFSETNFTRDLAAFEFPTLIIHGEEDQIAPLGCTGLVTSELVRGSVLKIYPGAPHGLCWTHKHMLNEDLLLFIKHGRRIVTTLRREDEPEFELR